MRILVVSDTHGDVMNLRRALLAQPTAETVIHLGDGEADLRLLRNSFPAKTFYQVRGNCDWGADLPAALRPEIAGKRFFCTHGHLYGVKDGPYAAVCAAREAGADVLLFGHTHQAAEDYEDGLYILNPGALSGYRPSYGTVDITPQGIVTNIIRLT